MNSYLIEVQGELSVLAAGNLRNMIISNKMNPGDRIPSEQELMSLFGISRSSIREAIKVLVAENVVEIRRGKGTFVSTKLGVPNDPLGLNFSDKKNLLVNLLETRLIIEPEIASIAASRATLENLLELEASIEKFYTIKVMSLDFVQCDVEFHTAIARCTQNEVLHRFLPIVCESIYEGYYETVTNVESRKKSVSFHEKIFNFIKQGESELAKLEMTNHIKQTVFDAGIIIGGVL